MQKNRKLLVKIAGVRLLPEGFKFGPHKHKDVEVIVVEKGSCIIHIKEDDRYVDIHKSEVLVIYPHVTHTFYVTQDQSCRISQIQFEMLETDLDCCLDSLRFIKNLKAGIKYEYTAKPAEIASCIGRINRNITDKELVNLYCMELLLLLSKGMEDHANDMSLNLKNHKLNSVIEYINNNIYENLVIEDIGEKFNISTRYLRKKFKEITGDTISSYITKTRIKHAKELLAIGNLSVTQVAFQMGFSSPQYFSWVFKNITGVTPGQYRVQHYRDNEKLKQNYGGKP